MADNHACVRVLCTVTIGICGLSALGSNAVIHAQQPDTARRVAASTTVAENRRVTIDVDNVSLVEVLRTIVQQARLAPMYDATVIPAKAKITLHARDVLAEEAFRRVLVGTGLIAHILPKGQVVIMRDTTLAATGVGIVAGIVIEQETKRPISGAGVTIDDTRQGMVSDANGKFRITGVRTGTHRLTVRYLGYKPYSTPVTVKNSEVTPMTVSLVSSAKRLDDVVTTATGSKRRIEVSNDVVQIDADKLINSAPIMNVTDLLVAAQVPGMIVTKSSGDPGAPIRVRFGGPGSISQNNDPVVIIDNVWIRSPFADSSIKRQIGPDTNVRSVVNKYLPSRLDDIDPSTIETIEIVRGPAAAALYGPDAANGVIRITTKRGRAGPARWDVRAFRNWGSPVGDNPIRYRAFGHYSYSTAPVTCSLYEVAFGACVQDSVVRYDMNDPLFRQEGNSAADNLSLTVSGGTDQLKYSLTGSLQDQRGPRQLSGTSRVELRQLGFPLTSHFRYPSQKRNRSLSARTTIAPRPGLDITLDFIGTQVNAAENETQVGSDSLGDTISTLLQSTGVVQTRANTTVTTGTLSLTTTWSPRSWVSGNMTLGIDRTYTDEESHEITQTCGVGVACQLYGQVDRTGPGRSSVYSARIQSTFLPNLGWLSRMLTVRPGIAFDLRRDVSSRFSSYINTPVNSPVTLSTTTPATATSALAGLSVNAYIMLFDRFSFDPGFRRDFAASRTLRNNAKSYPRFGTSWLVSDESYFPKTRFITLLRLRGALGYAAVQPDIGAIRGRYGAGGIVLNGQRIPTVVFDGVGNSRLQPERSFEIETGFDADLFGDRVSLTVTHSNKRNINTLINRTLAPSSGVTSTRQENVARILNRQTTMELSTRPIDLPGILTLNVGANIAVLDNQVKTLGPGVSPFGLAEQRYVGGYPVGGIWARPVLAVNDLNHDGILGVNEYEFGDSAVYIGTNIPRYTVGYNFRLTLLNRITFNAMLDYQGRYMQSRSADATMGGGMRGVWDPTSSLEEQALVAYISSGYTDYQALSVLRLQSAAVTFDIPLQFLKKLRARSAQLQFSGSNLGLWSRYRGRDPGVNSSPMGERTTDNGFSLGQPRAFVLHLRVGY